MSVLRSRNERVVASSEVRNKQKRKEKEKKKKRIKRAGVVTSIRLFAGFW